MKIKTCCLAILASATLLCCKKSSTTTPPPVVDPGNKITYVIDETTNFSNPERGLFYNINPNYSTNSTAAPLTKSALDALKASDNITLIKKYYLLYAYSTTAVIPASYIDDQLKNDLNVCRQAGFKLIPRFIYTWNKNFAPGAERDAEINITLGHITQLTTVLNDNIDVVDHLEAGLIGAYGEWHDSYFNHIDNNTLSFKPTGLQIKDALLQKLSVKRMVAFRYPKLFTEMYGTIPVSSATAHNGSNLSRSSFHNDGIAYDEWENGTYGTPFNGTYDAIRLFMRQQTLYTFASGEPGADTEYAKDRIADILKTYHYSSMCMNQNDAPILYAYLKSIGTYNTIARNLGYRFALTQATIPATAGVNQNLAVDIEIQNVGWATPHNERKVQIIFRNKSTSTEYKKDITADPRLWLPAEKNKITQSISLSGIPAGTYAMYINLPDPETTLDTNPAYSIRLANNNVWEATTGYNSLLSDVKIQ